MPISDLTTDVQQIIGKDGITKVDVITEDGLNKFPVKATSAPEPLGDLFFNYALNGGSEQMAVDGSVTTAVFEVPADPTKDLIVNSLLFEALASSINMQDFLGDNSPLANGILIEVKSQDQTFQFLPIKSTLDFDAVFSFGPARSFDLVFANAVDSMIARFGPDTPFTIFKQGTYTTDDYIKVFIRDNLTGADSIKFIATGGKR